MTDAASGVLDGADCGGHRGGRGIGRAIAIRLAQMGATVLLVARDHGLLESVRAEIAADGGSAEAAPCDLRSPEAVAALGERIREPTAAATSW